MPSSIVGRLFRPRVLFTFLVGLGVLMAAGGWLYQKATRIGSSYAYVRGDVVLVGAPMEGQVASVEVNPGQRVKQGDVLARLRDEALRPEVDRARALFDRARLAVDADRRAIEVEGKRIVATRRTLTEKVAATRAEEEIARIAAKHAKRTAQRSTELASRNYAPIADSDEAVANSAAADAQETRRKAERRQSEAELAALTVAEAELAARVERVALLEAEAATAKAALDAAQGRLDLTVIRAQHDGVVTRRILGPGASIRFSDPIVEMRLDGPVAIEAWIDERDLGHLAVGNTVRVSFRGLEKTFTGKIDALAMVSDAEVRSVSVTVPVGNRLAKSRWMRAHVTLENPDERLVPGLSAEVTIADANAADGLAGSRVGSPAAPQ
jgi:multidrug resistance efflux pump